MRCTEHHQVGRDLQCGDSRGFKLFANISMRTQVVDPAIFDQHIGKEHEGYHLRGFSKSPTNRANTWYVNIEAKVCS